MALKLRVEEVILNEETKTSFKESIKNNETFREWFKENVREMVDKYYNRLYAWEVWQIFTEETDKSLSKFNEYLETCPAFKDAGGAVKDTNQAQEWLDIYYPSQGRVWEDNWGGSGITPPRRDLTELFLDDGSVKQTTDRNKNYSLFDAPNKKKYNGLRGDLDLSDFESLEELRLCRNPFLGKVDIRNCRNLKKLYISSDLKRAIEDGESMKLSNLVIADNYPQLTEFVYIGTEEDVYVYNVMEKNADLIIATHNWELDFRIKWIKETKDKEGNIIRSWDFYAPRKSYLREELIRLYEVFEAEASDADFDSYRNMYIDLAEIIGGEHIKVIQKEDGHGNPLAFYQKRDEKDRPTNEVDWTKPLLVHGEDYELRKILLDIILRPKPIKGSWEDFRLFLNQKFLVDETIRKRNYEKYFKGVSENQVERFLDEVIESIHASERGENPDTSFYHVWPSEEEKVNYAVRGKEIPLKIWIPKREEFEKEGVKQKRRQKFSKLISFESFKYGRK